MSIPDYENMSREQLIKELYEAEEYVEQIEQKLDALDKAYDDAMEEVDYWKEQRYD